MADYKLITMVLIMLGIQTVLFMAQSGMDEVAAGNTVFNFDHSLLDTYTTETGGNLVLIADYDNVSVENANTIDVETGTPYTDTFRTIKLTLDDQNSAFGMIQEFFSQPYGFMMDMGLPQDICVAFGLMWYITLILLFVGFLRGSNQ